MPVTVCEFVFALLLAVPMFPQFSAFGVTSEVPAAVVLVKVELTPPILREVLTAVLAADDAVCLTLKVSFTAPVPAADV